MDDIDVKAEALKQEVEAKLPEFVRLVQAVHDGQADRVVTLQDAFAVDYQEDEYRLLGMAIKYAGLFGTPVEITGTNRETCP